MKKAAILILALILAFSLSLVVFAGCNRDDGGDEKEPIPSNSETLATGVAVAISYYGARGGGSAAPAAEEGGSVIDVNAGINFTIEAPGIDASLSAAAGVGISNLSESLEPVIENGVQSAIYFVNENSITVEEVTSDNEEFSNKYKITLSYIDEETSETVTNEFSLYLNVADGVDIEGTTSYDYTAKLVLSAFAVISFEGTATYNTAEQRMVFGLDINIGMLSDISITAQVTKDGNIIVDFGADGMGIVGTSVKVELGKLSDGMYGAEITVIAGISGNEVTVDATIKVEVVGVKDGDNYKLNLSGNIDAAVGLDLGIFTGEYKATGAINGQAAYDYRNDDFVLGLEGKIVLTAVENEQPEV